MRYCDGNSAEVSVLVMGDKRIKSLKRGNVWTGFGFSGYVVVIVWCGCTLFRDTK